jgi:hypothetical protein
MKKTKSEEFERFDAVINGLLSVPYSELQAKLAEERQAKAKKKKRPISTASSSRVSKSRGGRVS